MRTIAVVLLGLLALATLLLLAWGIVQISREAGSPPLGEKTPFGRHDGVHGGVSGGEL